MTILQNEIFDSNQNLIIDDLCFLILSSLIQLFIAFFTVSLEAFVAFQHKEGGTVDNRSLLKGPTFVITRIASRYIERRMLKNFGWLFIVGVYIISSTVLRFDSYPAFYINS